MGTSIFNKFPKNSTFEGIKVLNLGCGMGKYESPNVTNVDAYDVCNPNVTWNLEKTPLPFKDESYDLILANHIFEHLHNWWNCFEECARLLKSNGQIVVYVPSFGGDSGQGYRDHVSVINNFSFFGINGTIPDTNAWAETNKISAVNRLALFHMERSYFDYWWIRWSPRRLRHWMGEHLRNVVSENGFFFVKMPEVKK